MLPVDLSLTSINILCVCGIFRLLPSTLRASALSSVSFRPLFVTLLDFLSTFRLFVGSSVNFHQPSVHAQDLPLTYVNFPCVRGNFCQISMRPGELPSTSFTFPFDRGTFSQLPTIFMHQVDLPLTFEHPRELPSIFVNFPCIRKIPSNCCVSAGPPINFRYLSCIHVNFRQLSMCLLDVLLIFHASAGPSLNFHGISGHLWVLPSTSVDLPCGQEPFRQLPSNCRAARRHSVYFASNFRADRRPTINICQLSVLPRDLHQVPLPFRETWRPSVSFSPLSVQPGDLPSNSNNFPCGQRPSVNFRYISVWLGDFCQLL